MTAPAILIHRTNPESGEYMNRTGLLRGPEPSSGGAAHLHQNKSPLQARVPTIAAAIFLLVSAASIPRADNPDVPSSETDSLSDVISSLRARGMYVEALESARDLLHLRERYKDVKPHELVDLRWLVQTLESASGLSPQEQCEFRAADSLTQVIDDSYHLARFASGLRLVETQKEIWHHLLGEEHPLVMSNMRDEFRILARVGRMEDAERICRENLELSRKLYGGEHPETVGLLSDLGVATHYRGDYREAEALLREALRGLESLTGYDTNDRIVVLHNLGRTYWAQGRYVEADSLYAEAVDRAVFLHGELHGLVFMTLEFRGVVNTDWGRFEDAERYFARASRIGRAWMGHDHPHFSRCVQRWARLELLREDYARAESLLVEAATSYEFGRYRAGYGLLGSMSQSSPYPRLAFCRLELGKKAEAWEAVEKAHGRALADFLTLTGHRPLTSEEFAREDSLALVFAQVAREFRILEVEVEEAEREGRESLTEMHRRLDDVSERLSSIRDTWESFMKMIFKEYSVSEGSVFPLSRVQKTLSEETAIIGWLDVDDVRRKSLDVRWGYVIRDTGHVVWRRLPREEEIATSSPPSRSLEATFREEIAGISGSLFPPVATRELTETAALLWKARIEPLLDALEDVRQLIVIPNDRMRGVPVEAFVDNEGKPLLESFAVSCAPSATVCAWLRELEPGMKDEEAPHLLALGDPPFAPEHLALMEQGKHDLLTESQQPRRNLEMLRSVRDGDASACHALNRLPWSRVEVSRLSRLFPHATVLTGPNASEETLSRMAQAQELSEYSVVHLATHALVHDRSPVRSALILAEVALTDQAKTDTMGAPNDGFLTAEDILRDWRLDADLVVLSACETGLGQWVRGEGYIGLAHAFFQAGARSLLVSLWQVDDRATSLLMQRFYENYRGAYEGPRMGLSGRPMTKAEALREAKVWLRSHEDEHGARPFEHPHYWSSFVLIGDPG
jgi:CHAT domain-containing protein/tetratricopeptide (TPR) repeat protein